jgi:hypothetical protein
MAILIVLASTLSTGSEALAAAVAVSDALASSCLLSMITKDFVNAERRREIAGGDSLR